ncbi:MAG: hypothetical protein P8Y53_06195 [Pseudolabrys sp.]
MFSEALLAVPVAEFFIGTNWGVEAERDYESIFDTRMPGYFNYDLLAIKDEVMCKILKLALPEQSCQRLLILG